MELLLRITSLNIFGLEKLRARIINRLGKEAVREAIEENRMLGLPSPFEKDGELYYKMPDGSITQQNPFEK